jgi:DNA-binding transcriptional ArsR family regulator
MNADSGQTVALIALADPVRLQLVRQLAEGPCSVRRLAEGFPISRAAISQHLKVMLNLGIVDYSKHGPLNIYSLNPEPLQRLQSYLGELTQSAARSAEAWRMRSLWFDRI